MTKLTGSIKTKAAELGYSGCGIIPAVVFEEYHQVLDEHIKNFPESKEIYESRRGYANPPEGAKSIIVCVRGYNHYKVPETLKGRVGKHYMFHGEIPYSQAYRSKAEFEAFFQLSGMHVIKSHAIPMRLAAVKAGLGKIGRNNFLFTQQHGSYTCIDAWFVDAELEYEPPADCTVVPGCHENCQKCITACPTKALCSSFSMNWSKCVNPLMYAKEPLIEETKAQMGQWVYGCDTCQDVCPLNKGKLTGQEDFLLLEQFAEHLQPEKILAMNEEDYANIILPRLWYAGKDGLETWKRNVRRALENRREL
ncbi:MAG: hypothetical protein FWC32_04900 [Firmicutes bacterium]|nr:hypothetical protein [Bacillota bacterium]